MSEPGETFGRFEVKPIVKPLRVLKALFVLVLLVATTLVSGCISMPDEAAGLNRPVVIVVPVVIMPKDFENGPSWFDKRFPEERVLTMPEDQTAAQRVRLIKTP